MSQVNIKVFQLDHGKDLSLPFYATPDSSGMDLIAAVEEDCILEPGQRAIIPTGLTIALPKGYEAQFRPRSGLSAKHGVIVLNTPATIDADYRGELKVILINLGQESFTISRGMRIAQMVIAPVTQAQLTLVDQPLNENETERAASGFGSTGLYA